MYLKNLIQLSLNKSVAGGKEALVFSIQFEISMKFKYVMFNFRAIAVKNRVYNLVINPFYTRLECVPSPAAREDKRLQ